MIASTCAASAWIFEDVLANAADIGGNAVLNLGGQQLTLHGVSVSSLHQDDFLI